MSLRQILMAGRQRLDVTGTGSQNTEYAWSSGAILGMLFGLAIALHFGRLPQILGLTNPIDRLFVWRGAVAEPAAGQALIVTRDPGSQLTAVATLSPRGFAPLLAGNKREV